MSTEFHGTPESPGVQVPETPEKSFTSIFGDNSPISLLGDDEEDSIPEEVHEVLEANGLGKRAFSCMLKSIPDGVTDTHNNASYIKSWKNSIPSIEWVAKHYGPGNYMFVFQWRQKNEEQKVRTMTRNVEFSISDAFEDDYRQFQFELRIERKKKERQKMEKAKLDLHLDNELSSLPREPKPEIDPAEVGRKYVENIVEAQRMLGLNNSRGFDFEGLAKLVIPFIPPMLSMLNSKAAAERERMDKMMFLLMESSKSNNQSMIDVLKSSSGNQNGSQMMEEISKMLFSAIDMKKALSGENEKESLVDKVLRVVDGVAPMIIQMAAMPRQKMVNSMPFKAANQYAKMDKDIQAIINDPEQLEELIQRLQSEYGPEQTSRILEVAGIRIAVDTQSQEIEQDGRANVHQPSNQGENQSEEKIFPEAGF